MLNHIDLMGRLVRDPELRYTQSNTPVTTFSIAVDRDYGKNENGDKKTDFIDCVAWRSTAEFVSKYFKKGSMAVVSGSLQIREWTDKDGNKRRNAEVIVDNMYFGESKRRDDEGSYSASSSYTGGSMNSSVGTYSSSRASVQMPRDEYAELSDDDGELPF